MSSPSSARDGSRSTPRSSPSRSRLSSSHRGARLNGGYHRSPFRSSVNGDLRESPSRQLVEEFSKVVLDGDRHFRQSLDLKTAEQERKHQRALAEALAKHEAVRQSAERARERLEVQIRREQKAREEAERRAVEEEKRKEAAEEAERQRRRLEEERRREAERKQQAELKRQQEAHARQVEAQKQREEQEKVESKKREQAEAEADRKKAEEAAARARERQAQHPQPPPPAVPAVQSTTSAPRPNGATPTAPEAQSPIPPQTSAQQPQTSTTTTSSAAQRLTTTLDERKATHQQYLALHQRLKTFRAECEGQCKAAGFKNLGEMRRTIRGELGKLNKVLRDENKKRLAAIDSILTAARSIPNAPIVPDIREFIVKTPQNVAALESATDTTYPMIPLYLLHQLAKSAVARLITESGSDPETADPIGITLAQVLSKPEHRWNGISLIDLLWAKYRVRCPWLFGIPAPAGTDEEFNRMVTGLAAGYSALTLRDFSRSRNANPAPNTMWWATVAQTLNTPPGHTTVTQYVMLKALIENSVPRIIQIFGGAGRALLRRAVREFVQRGPRTKEGRLRPEVVAVEALQVTLHEKYGVSL